jgi:PKD repeat protein
MVFIFLPTGNGFAIGEAFRGNVISGNSYYGVEVDGAKEGFIQGNKIGTDPDGLIGVPNGYSGVFLQNGSDYNTIGGPGSLGNILSANLYFGIEIECSSYNQIKGNKIGVDISGVTPMPNNYSGIFVGFSTQNYTCNAIGNDIGGTGSGEENIVGYNYYYGINVCGQNAYYNTVSRNSVFCNSYGGISLVDGNYGQPNGNNSFSKPVITTASATGASGTAPANSLVELFLDDNCTLCQGRDYLGTVPASATGNWSYSGTLSGSLTATATDPANGNSSDFAACYFITSNLPPVAALVGLPISICAGDCVTFTDYSVNTPTSWQWSFPGGNPSSSTAQNPGQVCYNAPGIYEVQLIVENSTGIDTLFIPNYISVYATPGNVTLTTGSPYCTTDGLQTFTADIPGGIWLDPA